MVDAGSEQAAVVEAGALAADDLWRAQLVLGQARAQFLDLPVERRVALLDRQPERQRDDQDQADGGTDAERRAKQAAEDREKSLEEARQAETASLRLLAEERARLNGIQEQQAKYDEELQGAEQELSALLDEAIEWGSRATELVEKLDQGETGVDQADLFYDQLIPRLLSAREQLAEAIGALSKARRDAPGAGQSRLGELDGKVDRSQADALFQEVEAEHRMLRDRATAQAWQRAEKLNHKMESLRHARLALLPRLSAARQSSLSGLGATGFSQATEETRATQGPPAEDCLRHLRTSAGRLSSGGQCPVGECGLGRLSVRQDADWRRLQYGRRRRPPGLAAGRKHLDLSGQAPTHPAAQGGRGDLLEPPRWLSDRDGGTVGQRRLG